MDLKQSVRVLRERWRLVVLSMLLALLAAGLWSVAATPRYAASTQLFVSTSGDQAGNAQQAYQGGLFGQQRVKSYAEIVSSQPVVQRVRDALKLSTPVTELQSEITATAPLDTVLVDVTVTDKSPERAASIADELGRQFAMRVNELETPQGQSVSPVKVSVAQPPTVPTTPITPRTKLNLIAGLVIGLALGIGGALVLATLDTRLRNQEQVGLVIEGPVLGGFREEQAARDRPLVLDGDPFSARSEGFRQLRTNIRFLAVDSPIRSLVITSSLPSEGKTTVATNLAIALAQSGERVILVDADLRRPSIGELLGLNPQIGLTNLLVESSSYESTLQEFREDLPLQVLASGPIPPNPSELLGSHRMREIVSTLEQRSSIVIYDTPPLLPVTDAAVLALQTDGAILIARAGSTHKDQLRTSVASLRQVGAHVLGGVINRLPARRATGYGYGYSYSYSPRAGATRPTETASSTRSTTEGPTAESEAARS